MAIVFLIISALFFWSVGVKEVFAEKTVAGTESGC
jgi:hypothetical protein